ncbi:hypothetical protein ACVWXL_006434 [Bradyrhizobium sp. GM22.5]
MFRRALRRAGMGFKHRKTATVKTIRAEENRTKRLRMGLRLIDIVVE